MSQLSYLFGSLLELIYNVIGDYAISIIVFTVVVKLLLLPLTLTQTKSMKSMQLIQPKMDEIKKKYQNDPDKQNQKIMELYKEHKVNPLAGCLPLLIQFPIIIGLFNALREPVKYVFGTEAAYKIADTWWYIYTIYLTYFSGNNYLHSISNDVSKKKKKRPYSDYDALYVPNNDVILGN